MAVLKMGSLAHQRTWLTDVGRVEQLFFVSRHMETCSAWDLLRQSLDKEGRKDLLEQLCMYRSFIAVPEDYSGGQMSLLKVFKKNWNYSWEDVELWLAPVENTWLMSDDGKTIDRL